MVDITRTFVKTQGTCNTNNVAWCMQIKKENHSGCQRVLGKKPDYVRRESNYTTNVNGLTEGSGKRCSPKVTLEMSEVCRTKTKETTLSTVFCLIKLFPTELSINNSDTAVYVRWN